MTTADDRAWIARYARALKTAKAERKTGTYLTVEAIADLLRMAEDGIDARDRIVAALALCDEARVCTAISPLDCTNSCSDGPCDCSRNYRARSWSLDPEAVRAALAGTPEGLKDTGNSMTMLIQPDRPRNSLVNRVVYLPVKVIYDGLADNTNGSYFKGQLYTSPAYGPQTWSISEICVIDETPLQKELDRLRRELTSRGLGHVV